MAGIDQQLLGAGASAKNDWAHASAKTSLTFTGKAEFRRGVEIAIGINALATADAGLSKFVDATVRGNAFAQATANLQLRLPLNLFKDFGVVVGAEAVAQAAAGIEVGLGLSIGDFIGLLGQNRDSLGLPLELVLLLLDEAVVGGRFEVHVAASAMAYASVKIAGEVVNDPGFHYIVDAGLGLAAGVGFSGGLDLGIRDFRRFYGRAVDRTIASVVEGITPLIANSNPDLVPIVRAMAPVAATSLRVAYELGDYIAKNTPGQDHQAALNLSNHCVGIVLEESQRFLFGRCLEAGLQSLRRLVTHDVPTLGAGVWNGLMPQRQALANVLRRMPPEPLQPTDENAVYWTELLARATDLVAGLSGGMGAGAIQGMAMVFAASELLAQAIRTRINQGQAYAFAIGGGQVAVPPPAPFRGPLPHQPQSLEIRQHIITTLGRPAGHQIDYADLVLYLASDGITATLRGASPDVDAFLSIFQSPAIGNTLHDVIHALLVNGDAFVPNGSGVRNPQATLNALLGALSTFIDTTIAQRLVPAVNQQIADDNIKTYFNEVVVGTLRFTKRVAFQTVLDWEKAPIDQSAFTEALAGVMTMLLGRSLVLVADGFMTALQGDMQRACDHAAAQLGSPKDPFTAMGVPESPELKALLADTLRVGGEVFGPLPEDTRRRLRFVLYDVMETLPPTEAAQADLLGNLADQFFIPNRESLDELKDDLLEISRDRFALFVQRILAAGGEFLLHLIEQAIQDLADAVLHWVAGIEASIQRLFDEVAALERAIEGLLAQARQAFDDAVEKIDALLETFARTSLRNRLRRDIKSKLYKAGKDVLQDNGFYQNLPSPARRAVRGILKDAIEDLIEGPIMNPIFDALGAVAGEVDGLLDDVRELDPDQPLGSQLLDLVIDRMEDAIRDAFGGSSPRIDVGFTASAFGFSHHFSLGTIQLSFSKLFSLLRAAIADLDFYKDALADAATSLSRAFAKSNTADTKQHSRDAKQADHDRLRRIRGEFTSDPKTITIVNPVEAVAYDGDVEVEIHLGEVPASYLGLNADEQPRVLILINGAVLSLESVTVAASLPPVPRSTAAPLAQGPARALALSPSLRSVAAARAIHSTRPIARQAIRTAANGTTVTEGRIENVLPGRRMTPTKRGILTAAQPPGSTLRFQAPRDQLTAGANTLCVVVLDPGGQRYQQVVNFAVTAARKPGTPRLPGIRLPAAPGRQAPGSPVSRAGGINLHFDRAAMEQRVRTGVRDLARKPLDGPR